MGGKVLHRWHHAAPSEDHETLITYVALPLFFPKNISIIKLKTLKGSDRFSRTSEKILYYYKDFFFQ